MAEDDIQSTSFTLSHDTQELSLNNFLAQDFAVRLTSVGEIDGSRADSVKIGGTAPDAPTSVDDPVSIAVDNSISVYQDEGFNLTEAPDVLDGPYLSVLDDDITGEEAYSGLVTAANGSEFADSIIVSGSNGGLLKVSENGNVDFSANGEFDHLSGTDTALTQFTYTIEGGSMATVDVFVFAHDQPADDGGDSEGDPGYDFPEDDFPEDDLPEDGNYGDIPGYDGGYGDPGFIDDMPIG
jgi:hypothetical protein